MSDHRLRAILFGCVLLGLAITIPFFTLRAQGYRFDIERLRFVPTGGIAVNALPLGSLVSVTTSEGRLIKEKETTPFSTTAFIADLLPGTYTVSVVSPNRRPWSKEAVVERQETTSFAFVRLLPETLESSHSFLRSPETLLSHPDGDVLIGWDGLGLVGVDLTTAQNLSALTRSVHGNIDTAFWLDANRLLVHFASGTAVLVEDALSTAPRVSPLSLSGPAALPFEEEHILLLGYDGTLTQLTAVPSGSGSRFVPVIVADNVVDVATHGRAFSYLDSRGIVWTKESGSSMVEQRNIIGVPIENIAGTKLIASRHGTGFVALEAEGTAWLLSHDSEHFEAIAEGVRDVVYSFDDKKALLVGTREITLYALRDRLEQPERTRGTRETVTRYSDEITYAAFLAPEEEHIAIQSGGRFHIVELDPRGGRNTMQFDGMNAATVTSSPPQLFMSNAEREAFVVPIPVPGLLSQLLL